MAFEVVVPSHHKSIIKVIDPKVGETVYDGAVGSAGFLVEAFEHMNQSKSFFLLHLQHPPNEFLHITPQDLLHLLISYQI